MQRIHKKTERLQEVSWRNTGSPRHIWPHTALGKFGAKNVNLKNTSIQPPQKEQKHNYKNKGK